MFSFQIKQMYCCLLLIYVRCDGLWKTEKCHECANMGKVKPLELWWQLYVTWLPVWDLENFRPMDFCSTECTHQSVPHNTHPIHKYITCTNTLCLTQSHAHCITWHPNIFIFVLLCFLPFFSKFVIILNEVNQFTNFMSEREEARSFPEFKREETIIAKLEQPSWNPVSYSANWEKTHT